MSRSNALRSMFLALGTVGEFTASARADGSAGSAEGLTSRWIEIAWELEHAAHPESELPYAEELLAEIIYESSRGPAADLERAP
jgi:hypothetical protein